MDFYLLWSWEHRMWWAPNAMGYTSEVVEAGLYTKDEAASIVLDVIPPGSEVAVRIPRFVSVDQREAFVSTRIRPPRPCGGYPQ